MHAIQCRCGTLRGQLEGSGVSNRVICYCADCQAFARYLGRDAEVLDQQGGTEIVQVAHPRLKLLQGVEHLAALRLSDKGMLRWYATCCNTPIGNTLAEPSGAFIGLIHACLDRLRMDQDFGSQVARLNTAGALGVSKPKPQGLLGVILRFIWIQLSTRIGGRYKHSCLFTDSGSPRVQPVVLTAPERERLNSTA